MLYWSCDFYCVHPWRLINTQCWGVPFWGEYPQTSTKIHGGTRMLRWWHLWLFSSVVTLRAHWEIVLYADHLTSGPPCGHTLFDLNSLMSRRKRMVYGLRMFVNLDPVKVSAAGTTFVPCWIIWLTSKFGEQTTHHYCFLFYDLTALQHQPWTAKADSLLYCFAYNKKFNKKTVDRRAFLVVFRGITHSIWAAFPFSSALNLKFQLGDHCHMSWLTLLTLQHTQDPGFRHIISAKIKIRYV